MIKLNDRHDASHLKMIGGKALNLSKLIEGGFNVPPGVVLSTDVFARFVRENGIGEIVSLPITVNLGDRDQLKKRFAQARGAISDAPFSAAMRSEIASALDSLEGNTFSVRSSAPFEDGATASWSGKFETFLSVTKEEVELFVKRCWMSLFSDEVLYYISRSGINTGVFFQMAVIVQEMVQSERSGVSFSVTPDNCDSETMLVEFAEGLGENLVSGRVTPKTFYIDKPSCSVFSPDELDENDEQLAVIAASHTKDVEQHFGTPQDVEWATFDGEFFILQSRPITTLVEVKPPAHLLSGPSVQKFRKIFGPERLPFLYEDMIASHYMRWENVTILTEGVGTVFANHLSIRNYWNRPDAIRLIDLQKAMDRLMTATTNANDIDVGLESSISFYSNILKDYGLFDDPLWSAAPNETPYLEDSLEFLSTHKNSVREEVIDRLFFSPENSFVKILVKLSAETGIELSDLEWCTASELQMIKQRGEKALPALDTRKNHCAFYRSGSGQVQLVEPPISQKLDGSLNQAILSDANDLRGLVAHGGDQQELTGRVRILDKADGAAAAALVVDSVERGAVVVTSQTDPSLEKVFGVAGAVITETGGITCHAAISARENNVPTIVGVTGVLDALRDGDEVTLNLFTGRIFINET